MAAAHRAVASRRSGGSGGSSTSSRTCSDTFKLSTDPLFVEKVVDVVGLYHNPPERAVVLCVDEKSQIQALDRSQPVLPMMPGMPERRTHDYVRHGITSLFAAFNIADGTVISELHRRHRAIEFKKFLITIDKAVPADLDVHLVCDNYATHKTPTIKTWLARHPRFHMHFTPTGSSWINQVERWFGYLTDQTDPPRRPPQRPGPGEPTSAPGSRPGTTTRDRSSGPRPPTRSSNPSHDICRESPAQDTSPPFVRSSHRDPGDAVPRVPRSAVDHQRWSGVPDTEDLADGDGEGSDVRFQRLMLARGRCWVRTNVG